MNYDFIEYMYIVQCTCHVIQFYFPKVKSDFFEVLEEYTRLQNHINVTTTLKFLLGIHIHTRTFGFPPKYLLKCICTKDVKIFTQSQDHLHPG